MSTNSNGTKLSTESVEEIKQLNDFARGIFSVFATWWAFFVTKNLVAANFLTGEDPTHAKLQIAWVVLFLDVLGAGFSLIVSVRLVQINDRIVEIATQRSPKDSPLGNPSMSSVPLWLSMFKELFVQWFKQPKRTLSTYNSPVPLSFYLWCTMPSIGNCLIVAYCWYCGICASDCGCEM